MNSKYFFLYLKTGGGHLAPARSVMSFLKTHHPEILAPVLVDGLQEAPKPVRQCLEDGYRYLQAYGRWFYALLYFLNKWTVLARLNARMVSSFVVPYLERRILSELPEKIVIFHFFLIKPVKDILARNGLTIPTLVVVTDPFTAHPLWFLERENHFIVFSEQLRDHCIRKQIKAQNITVFPFILDEKFAGKPPVGSKAALKQQWGFDLGKKLILVIGGADGIPRGKRIVQHLLQDNPGAELAVVCGNNEKLRKTMLALKEKPGSKALMVFGYIDSVHELLQISDVVITKCGASMFMETLLLRKVPIVNNYLWEQEKGNVDFLRRNQMGIYEPDTKKLSAWVNKLFTDSHFHNLFDGNIDRARLVNGVDQVSEYILRFKAA